MKHKLLITALFILTVAFTSRGQNLVVNASFENNKAPMDMINCTALQFDTLMSNVYSFGTYPNPDIISSNDYCNYPENGKWYIALTGGGTDAVAMQLSSPVEAGKKYALSFYDEGCDFAYFGFEVGISSNDSTFGTQVYQAPVMSQSKWVHRVDTFTATTSGSFLTFDAINGDIGFWGQLDNVSLKEVKTGPDVAINMPASGCQNQNITVSVDSSSTESFVWNFGAANIISSNGAGTYNVSWSAAGTYYVSITATDSLGTSTSIDTIVINAAPTATFAVDSTIAAGQTDLVNYTGNGNVATSTFNWNLNNAIVENNLGNAVGLTYGIPGKYNIALTVTENGCTSAPIQQSITVISPLTVATPICTDSICMISYSVLANNAANYSWSFPGANVMAGSGAGPFTLQYVSTGKYAVSVNVTIDSLSFSYTDTVNVTSGDNCGSHSKDSVLAPVNNGDTTTLTAGINTVAQKLGIANVYPNPTLTILNIDLKNVNPGIIHMQVYDVLGRTVINNYQAIAGEESSLILDTNNLPAGSYFLQISDNNSNYSDARKFIKLL